MPGDKAQPGVLYSLLEGGGQVKACLRKKYNFRICHTSLSASWTAGSPRQVKSVTYSGEEGSPHTGASRVMFGWQTARKCGLSRPGGGLLTSAKCQSKVLVTSARNKCQ